MKRLVLVTAALVFVAVAGFAQGTPDEETPANEGVCDDLMFATPGLYGLCVAYCEAQDCADPDPISAQCKGPNPKLLEIYNRKKQASDSDMPCVQQGPCPCFTQAQAESLWPPDYRCDYDTQITTSAGEGEISGLWSGLFGPPPDYDPATHRRVLSAWFYLSLSGETVYWCHYQDETLATPIDFYLDIEQSEQEACTAIINAVIDANFGCPVL